MSAEDNYGPTLPISKETHAVKYRAPGETFYDRMVGIAAALAVNESHRKALKYFLLNQSFLPGGRIQSGIGALRVVTAINCFVSQEILDNTNSIFEAVMKAFKTMRLGGGIGFNFSNLRPNGALIKTLDSSASGPLSFMHVFDTTCKTVSSAGHRRGAMMSVLNVDHPDIEAYIDAKHDQQTLSAFNTSIAITDEFMQAVIDGKSFDLRFEGRVYKTIDARGLWDKILRSTWDYAEPGVLFIDRINRENNLSYCEKIQATNPCGELPLPENGACVLGSINLVKFIIEDDKGKRTFDTEQFKKAVENAVIALDQVIDKSVYPLPQQQAEAFSKRRIGLGFAGTANAIEALGHPYGSKGYITKMEEIAKILRDTAYMTSVDLAKRYGAFPKFDADKYLQSEFIKRLPKKIQNAIKMHGIRNSHLISMAPTGTIALCADNISGGIEPVFALEYERKMGKEMTPVIVTDYGYRVFGVKGRTADEVSVKEHVDVLCAIQKYVDSAVSKTVNVGNDVTWEEFKDVYMRAYLGGAKGCTTFRAGGKRFALLTAVKNDEGPAGTSQNDEKASADESCTYDPVSGMKSCAD